MWFRLTNAHAYKTIKTSNKILLDVEKEKEQKQEIGWRVSFLPIPAFHYCELSDCGSNLLKGWECLILHTA